MHKASIEKEQYAHLVNVNPRKESFGEDLRNAADLKFRTVMSKEASLALFVEPQAARSNLWDENGVVRDEEVELDVSSTHEYQCLTVKGNGHKEMRFDPCRIKLEKAVPRQAFTVELTLTAQVHPAVKEIGPLCDCQKKDVKITLTNSDVPEEPQQNLET